jgi:hypothetical protein
MSNTNTGGPAFPSTADNEYGYPAKGMTLRDYFAAKAMQNVFNTGGDDDERQYVAMHAYKMADAMLKAREA